jgi:aspartyl-tRNA(Asn)/glutamyl-tRNA(Gln) amidotransferase subunit A
MVGSQWDSIAVIAVDVQAGKTKAVDLVERALKTIDEKSEYNAVIASVHDRARARAKEIDERIAKGEKVGRLAGVPFIAKDNFLTYGSETTAASNILKGFVAPYQATAIERLEAEGAICVAKANLDAFAHGSSTENSDFMTTKNPHDMAKVPGGSSGGSAAAVILDMAPFALGTDTGGSIRLPAAFCGAVGLKPTYGLVSRSGVVAMASSTDVIGPLARTVEDAALVLDIMSGKDELDSTTIDRDKNSYVPNSKFQIPNSRIGIIKEYMAEGLDVGVKKQIEAVAEKLKSAGTEVIEVSLPSVSLALSCYYIIMPAEVSSNLSRYDGQRYGFSHPEAKSLDESYNMSRSEGFGKEANKALKLRTRLIDEFSAAFKKVDFLIGPTAPSTAFEIGANAEDPLQMYLTDIMTVAANLVGNPAVSIPAGMIGSMPVGLQLMAPQRRDRELLALAKKTEELIS